MTGPIYQQIIDTWITTQKDGATPLHITAQKGRAATQLLLEARCNIDLNLKGGLSALQAAQRGARRNRHADTEHKAKRC